MKRMCVRRIVAFCLIFCMLSSTICPVFAETTTDDKTKIEDIGNGKMFIQETDEKTTAIVADNTTHIITISIKHTSDPNTVYQWIFNDYPEEEFDMDDLSFWERIIDCAEGKIEEATVVHFTYEEVTADTPMVMSSAGADLIASLEEYHGTEHTDQHIRTEVINGKIFHMYEHLYFYITTARKFTWDTAISLSSLVVTVLGIVATSRTMSIICGVLGLASWAADTLIPEGQIREYECSAKYHRYVKLDAGSTYALTDKIVTYAGYEDTDLNSTGRASIVPDTKEEIYSYTEEHFNDGVFDEAYECYIMGG